MITQGKEQINKRIQQLVVDFHMEHKYKTFGCQPCVAIQMTDGVHQTTTYSCQGCGEHLIFRTRIRMRCNCQDPNKAQLKQMDGSMLYVCLNCGGEV